jgi:tetratricopeptide (TPR) repeat protein
LVRINDTLSPYHTNDLAWLQKQPLSDVMLSKCETPEQLALALTMASRLADLPAPVAGVTADLAPSVVATDAERAQLLERTATLLVRLGECESALRLFEEASAILEAIGGQEVGLAEIILGRGEALYGLGRHDEAHTLGRQSLEILEALASPANGEARRYEQGRLDQGIIRSRNLIGKVAIFFVHYEEAISLFEANHQLAARWGWEKEKARAQANIGVVAIQQRRFDEAHQRLSDALELSKIPGSLPRAYCLLNLGNVYQRQARYDKALDHFLEALRATRQSGDTGA